jgi:transporter family-2 protein
MISLLLKFIICHMNLLTVFAFTAGAAIATQMAMNAQLGSLLKNPLLATSIAFLSSMAFTLVAALINTRSYPSIDLVRSVPVYLWFSGGILSAIGISTFYYLIPKMGMGPMMSFALSGQLVIAITAGHFGWFNTPLKPLDGNKTLGLIALISGVVLINWEA